MTVISETHENTLVVTINRPQRRNAVDLETARSLYQAFLKFDQDPSLSVAVLTGVEGNFCAGADLQAVAAGQGNQVLEEGDFGPMGPTRLRLSKPVIAAVEGYAVAGGLEMAIWCDLRVAASDAKFGVFCRRFGVPLIDMGTVRLPRLIGQSRAADMILTGREVSATEALEFGLVNRLVDPRQALPEAITLARDIAAFPQQCMRNDRASMLDQWSLDEQEAMQHETRLGLETIGSGETVAGATAFTGGKGKHGSFN